MRAETMETVLNKAGKSAGDAIGPGVEGLAGDYIGLMFSPWGILGLGLLFLLIRAIR